MSIHDDARTAAQAAAEAVYDAELGRRTALLDAAAEQLEVVTNDRDRLAGALAASEDELAAARARIAELEKPAQPPVPPVVVKESRPQRSDSVVWLEDLGVSQLRPGAHVPAAAGKALSLPGGVFELDDYAEGDGKYFMSGLMLNPKLGPAARRIIGAVDPATGEPVTTVRMKKDSSHWRSQSAAEQPTTPPQVLASTIQIYDQPNGGIENLIIEGTEQPHLFHGVRVNSDNAVIRNVRFRGASKGTFNMPPGETYSALVAGQNILIEDVDFDGTLNGQPATSTLIGIMASGKSTIRNARGRDMRSGFLVVYWKCTGTHELTAAVVQRPGTGGGGFNGCLVNVEESEGTYLIDRPKILLDGAWSNPVIGGKQAFPAKPAARHQGKFGHIIAINTQSPSKAPLIRVTDPEFDTAGLVDGVFRFFADHSPKARFELVRAGVASTEVAQPDWYKNTPPIVPAKQFARSTSDGNSGLWGQ